MSVEWWVVCVDPSTRTPAPDVDSFGPPAIELEEIDLLLSGQMDGPVSQLLAKCENVPGTEEMCPGWYADPKAVKRFAKRLKSISPEKYASSDVVFAHCLHSFPTDEERMADPDQFEGIATPKEFFESLTLVVDEFRRFVVAAADRGQALIFSVGG